MLALCEWTFPTIEGRSLMIHIDTNLPGTVKEFAYARNHHYVKLRDDKGREIKLVEHGLIQYVCGGCKFKFWAESNMAKVCPACKDEGSLSQAWMKPQISLVPEGESDFVMPTKPAPMDDETTKDGEPKV